eukprot:superscaffoldBa00000319_g3764
MAFANLFTSLSAVNEGVDSPGQPAFTHRNDSENGKRNHGRKRKIQGEQPGPHNKKQCYQFQKTRTYNYKAINYQKQNTDSEHAGFTKDVNVQVNRTRFMSQEFKDQNALMVDGRLLCRHFLWGSPEKVNDESSTEHVNTKQQVNLTGSHSPAHQQLPNISSHKGSSVAATSNSVLKTLFLCLSPYQQDGEQQDNIQISVTSESEKKDESSTGCVFVEQQQRSKIKGRRRKNLKTQDSHKKSTEKTVAHWTEHQSSRETPQISLKATDPDVAEHQLRISDSHNFPFKAVLPMTQPHPRQTLKQTSEERTWVKGNMAVTPLKDLFKTLDPTVSHFRH